MWIIAFSMFLAWSTNNYCGNISWGLICKPCIESANQDGKDKYQKEKKGEKKSS